MPGATATGAVGTSISTLTVTLIPIETLIAVSTKVETEDKAAGSSIIQSTVKVCRIAIRARRRSSIARAPMTRSNHGSSFAGEPNRGGKSLVATVWEIAAEWATVVESVIVAE